MSDQKNAPYASARPKDARDAAEEASLLTPIVPGHALPQEFLRDGYYATMRSGPVEFYPRAGSADGDPEEPVDVTPCLLVLKKGGRDQAVPDFPVRFEVVSGGGTITTASDKAVAGAVVKTGADGVARIISWTLGNGTQENTLRVFTYGHSRSYTVSIRRRNAPAPEIE